MKTEVQVDPVDPVQMASQDPEDHQVPLVNSLAMAAEVPNVLARKVQKAPPAHQVPQAEKVPADSRALLAQLARLELNVSRKRQWVAVVLVDNTVHLASVALPVYPVESAQTAMPVHEVMMAVMVIMDSLVKLVQKALPVSRVQQVAML